MNDNPLVSIIMPAYNAEKTIKESIESVLKQTYENWELLVVNDGSKDNTATIVNLFNDTRIKFIEQENAGVANARNHAIRLSSGEYIAFLDSDDLWLDNKLEIQINFMIQNNSKFVYSKTKCIDEDGNITSFFNDFEIDLIDKEKILVFDFIPILTVVLSKEVIDSIGYFDEFLRGTEDWDYWIQVLQRYDVCFIDEFLALYRISSSSLSGNLEKHMLEEKKVYEKYSYLYNNDISKISKWFKTLKLLRINLQKKRIGKFFVLLSKLFILNPSLTVSFLTKKIRAK